MFDGLRKKIGEFRENVVERIKAKDESEELEEEKVEEVEEEVTKGIGTKLKEKGKAILDRETILDEKDLEKPLEGLEMALL